VKQKHITPENTEFVIISFEGPDRYAMAGGLGVRVDNLSSTLASMRFPTHLFYVGDPRLKSQDVKHGGKLTLHRWCQWISRYYPGGVYEAEQEKLFDFNESLPWYIKDQIVRPAVEQGKLIVILGEEWHTAEVMCRLSDILHWDGLRDQVILFWNANNTFSFHRINWGRLSFVTTVTTVSRYMKHLMWGMGLNPLVIPNGIPHSLLQKVDDAAAAEVRAALNADLVLCKVARWDPDKRWDQAIEATARLKERGLKTVLLARGGVEPHGQEVLQRARSLGLRVKTARLAPGAADGFLQAIREAGSADVIDVRFPLPLDFLRLLYRAANGVLANSGHEPFGIVGLEAMAASGIAITGSTGEDYAIPFVNALVLETADPMEIVGHILYLRDFPEEDARIRREARHTARYFTWEAAVWNLISKLENQARLQGILAKRYKPARQEPPPVSAD